MKRNVENFVAFVEHMLDPVAMVDIPVKDQHPVKTLFPHLKVCTMNTARYFLFNDFIQSHRALSSNSHIIEKTESMGSVRLCVVAGGSDHSNSSTPTFDHLLNENKI